tara:strand:- start:306 stop:761 length:456 start_codon:yes stop_codon:yes gene_type:complete
LNDFKNKSLWRLTKKVLPQHTDHAGVMWHGSYFNFLEECRVDALEKVGISYSDLSKKGFEIPVFSIKIKYKLPFFHGEMVHLISEFNVVNKLRLNCKTLFVKPNGDIGAEALIDLVLVYKKNGHMKLAREIPAQVKRIFLLLEEGPKSEND